MKGGARPNAGRKSEIEENSIIEMYKNFIPKVLIEINKALNSKDKNEKKWGVEMATKGLVKMLPTIVEGNPNKPLETNSVIEFKGLEEINNYLSSKLSKV